MDLWVPDVRLARCAPRLIDATGRFNSPLTQTFRSITRPGDRWGFRVDYQSLTGLDRARTEALVASMRGAANRLIFSPPDYVQRGSWSTPELIVNGSFANGSTGWTASSATLVAADRLARVQNSGAASGFIANSTGLTLTTSVPYVARAIFAPGNKSAWKVTGGTSAGGATAFTSGSLTDPSIYTVGFVPASATFFLSLVCNTAVSADFVHYVYASLSRCALVNGANQTGSGLIIDGLPNSTTGLLLPGDWIEVNLELKRITAPLNSDGSGNGFIQFSPPLRTSPADNTPIIVNAPFGRFIYSGNENGWQTEPGRFATSSFDMVEAA